MDACLVSEGLLTIAEMVRSQAVSEATVTSKGQITIPADIRQAMGLMPQDRVVFTRLANGTVVMRAKKRSAQELAGMLKIPAGQPPVAIDDMRIGND